MRWQKLLKDPLAPVYHSIFYRQSRNSWFMRMSTAVRCNFEQFRRLKSLLTTQFSLYELITHEINGELTFEMTTELTFENVYQFRSALPHSTCHLTFEDFYTLIQLLPAVFYQKVLSFYRKLRRKRKLTFQNGLPAQKCRTNPSRHRRRKCVPSSWRRRGA